MRALLLAAILALPAPAQETGQWNSATFLGLNDAVSPAVLGYESPDLLNVESNFDATAILKRKGYSTFASLTVASAPVTGSHSFVDSSGNRLDIVCQNRNCAKSTNGNAFATFLTTAAGTGAIPTRWSFVDVGGILYGANDKRDPILKYDGTTLTSPAGMPAGSILEMTHDRLAVGDIASQPNRVHYSSAGAFEQFTTGVNAEDSFFDEIGASGDRVRGLKCIDGNCFIFKTASITLCEMADQYNTQCSVISPNIGTTDPGSIVAAGSSIYFRAQDKNYWRLGRDGLENISKKIPVLVKNQSGGLAGGENTNTQTTKADWDAGVQDPLLSWNTSIINGSIFPSSFTFRDGNASDFGSGTLSGPLAVNATGTLTVGAIPSTYTVRYEADAVPDLASPPWVDQIIDTGCTETASGSIFELNCPNGGHRRYRLANTMTSSQNNLIVFRAKVDTGAGVSSIGFWNSASDSNATYAAGYIGYVEFRGPNSAGDNITAYKPGTVTGSLTTAYSTFTILLSSYTSGSAAVRFWKDGVFIASITTTGTADTVVLEGIQNAGGGADFITYVDFIYYGRNVGDPGNVDIGSGTFTSRIYDTAFSTPTSGTMASLGDVPATTELTYSVRNSTSPNNDMWTAYVAISTDVSTHVSLNKRYWQYRVGIGTNGYITAAEVRDVSLVGASTGTYRTKCIQPNSSISAWGTVACAQTLTGAGSEVFYATSAATCAGLPTTPPVNAAGAVQNGWTAETNNATLTIATNTAVYIGWRSLLGSATDQAQVDACVLSWNEGTPTQPAWATFDSVKNAIYWTTTINNSSTTNRMLKYDLNLDQWYPFSISAQAPRVINNNLYFGGGGGGPGPGTWNLYGLVDADAGTAINGYWKSKDIGSDRPFQGKSFKTVSVLSRNNGSGNLTGTWTLSNAKTGTYTISLSTGTGINYARSNYALPFASPQEFINIQVSNNGSTPFEVLGLGVGWQVTPWRIEGP